MPPRPVYLTEHRNNEWQRTRKRLSGEMLENARRIAKAKAVAGYVIMAWNAAGDASVAFDTSEDVVPARAVPAWVMAELQDAMRGR